LEGEGKRKKTTLTSRKKKRDVKEAGRSMLCPEREEV